MSDGEVVLNIMGSRGLCCSRGSLRMVDLICGI